MAERSYRVLLWSLALVGLAADQASKYGVFAWLRTRPHQDYALFETSDTRDIASQDERDEKFRGFRLMARFEADSTGAVRPHVNQGALFGFLREHKMLANAGFALISLMAAVAIIYWSTQASTARDRWLCAALGLILGGTLGNFYDRLVFQGVRDFMHWHYGFDWPVFNLADCFLVCGAFLLLVQAFSPQPAANSDTEPACTADLVTAPKA